MWSWLLDWLGLTWINLNSWRDSRSHAQNRRSIRGWGGHRNGSTLLHMHTHRKSPKVPIRRKDIKSETKCKNHNLRVICKMFGRVEIVDKVLIQYTCTVKCSSTPVLWERVQCACTVWGGCRSRRMVASRGEDEFQHIHGVSIEKTSRKRKTHRKDATKTHRI